MTGPALPPAAGRRIVFACPPGTGITGGKKMIFRHAAELRAHGFNAVVFAPKGFPPELAEGVAVIRDPALAVADDDILVLNEDDAAFHRVARRLKARKVLFCQGVYLLHRGFGAFRTGKDARLGAAVAASATVARFLRERFPDIPVHTVPCFVDGRRFRPGDKRMQVCYAPRKRPLEAGFIIDMLRTRHPEFAGVPFVQMVDMSEAQVAETMACSAVFLSLGRMEGLGLMPLEAMAAGCLVTGFTGVGGREYATPDNGFWAEDEDCLECVDGLARALALHASGDARATAMRAAGAATVARYGYDGFSSALVEFWSGFVEL